MPHDELMAQSALDQSAALRRGEVTCEALTAAYLERIAARDGGLGAFVHVNAERALRAARMLDRERRRDPRAPERALRACPRAPTTAAAAADARACAGR